MENEMDCESCSSGEDEYYLEECQTDFDEDDEFEEIIPLKDDSKFILKQHTNVVLSVVCDSKNSLIFTGGMDDKIIVWNMESGQQISVLSNHSDSVTNLCLNQTDLYLVSGDLDGMVLVWKITKISENSYNFNIVKQIKLAEIIAMKWSYSTVINDEYLYICDKTGQAQSFSLDSLNDESSMEMIPIYYTSGKGCSCNGFNIILDGRYVAILYGGSCDLHEDCGNAKELLINDVNTYSSVKVDLKIVANEDEDNDEGLGAGFETKKVNNAELVAIGDWSQIILVSVVESSVSSSVSTKLHRIPVKDGGLVTNVAFSDSLPYIAFASKSGLIGVYDISHSRVRYMWDYNSTIATNHDNTEGDCREDLTVSQLKWNPGKPQFFTAGLDGRICLWDGRNKPTGDVPSWWGHSGIIWDMCVVKGGCAIVTVSEDRTGRFFEI